MSTINELKWSTLTAAINEMKSPNQFLKKFLWSNHQSLSTEDIELSLFTKAREVAPFVRKNGEAILIVGHGETFQTVSAPNIRIKRPFTPSELLFQRRPGTVIFTTGADAQLSALQAHIARDMQVMSDMITNAEEYLCAQSLQGQISYSVNDQEVYQITFPRAGGNNIVLGTFWDNADPTLPTVEQDFLTVKRVLSDQVALGVTDAIMGRAASSAFQRVMKAQFNLATQSVLQTGNIDFAQQFTEDGVIYLGRFSGVDCWEYGRTAAVNGVSTPMIRDKYVEFVSRSSASERVMYYGAIPDMEALQGRLFQGERFAKSWNQQDPSAMIALAHSRPLPVPRRPNATVSMKVVSG